MNSIGSAFSFVVGVIFGAMLLSAGAALLATNSILQYNAQGFKYTASELSYWSQLTGTVRCVDAAAFVPLSLSVQDEPVVGDAAGVDRFSHAMLTGSVPWSETCVSLQISLTSPKVNSTISFNLLPQNINGRLLSRACVVVTGGQNSGGDLRRSSTYSSCDYPFETFQYDNEWFGGQAPPFSLVIVSEEDPLLVLQSVSSGTNTFGHTFAVHYVGAISLIVVGFVVFAAGVTGLTCAACTTTKQGTTRRDPSAFNHTPASTTADTSVVVVGQPEDEDLMSVDTQVVGIPIATIDPNSEGESAVMTTEMRDSQQHEIVFGYPDHTHAGAGDN